MKKIFLSLFFSCVFILPAMADEHDFGTMNPTVKVGSYKMLFNGNTNFYGSGSGTVINDDGVVITNSHVIFNEEEFKPLDAFEICITFDTEKEPVCEYTAALIAYDRDMDIALLKINDKDIFRKDIGDLSYLSYKTSSSPRERSEVSIIGYPGSGGKTITITKGQISGFDEFNNYKYFKTDTDFDHGSSGGTALDVNGNFVGIPTYIRSYAENVGYFLDIQEAEGWIDEHIKDQIQKDRDAERALIKELARYAKANDKLKYEQDSYPFVSVTLPEGWEFLEINNDSFFAAQKSLSNPAAFSVYTAEYQYRIDEGYMDKLEEELEKIKETYPDYKKEDATFAGQDAWKVTYTSIANKNTAYYIPYGYTIVIFSFSADLDEAEKKEKALQHVIDSFDFAKPPTDDPGLSQTLSYNDPFFNITMPDSWRIRKHTGKEPSDLLAEAVEKDNFEGSFAVYYYLVPKDERHLSEPERLDSLVKNMGSRKLVYKNDQVMLGGLNGFLYIYEYEGREYQKLRKFMAAKVRNGDYQFSIEYDDFSDVFDSNLEDIKKILRSFRFGSDTERTSRNSFGSLGHTFNDIQYHRFSPAISDLAEKGIVKGYPDGGFHPEQIVNRAEALKIIFESKNHLENEKSGANIIDFDTYISRKSGFYDVKDGDALSKYIKYASEKEFIKGYGYGLFKPWKDVDLAEALKLIFHAYEIPIWAGETSPWFKKYMDKGFELGLIPYGMYDPGKALTRAELAYLVSTVYGEAK